MAMLLACAGAQAQLGLAVGADDRPSASTMLLAASATGTIRVCAFEARNQMLLDMESRIKATAEALSELTRPLPMEKQQAYQSVLHDVKIQEAALHMAMQAAEKATEKTWPQVRDALAFSYVDFVTVVTRTERIAAGRDG